MTQTVSPALQLRPEDDVAVLRRALVAGNSLGDGFGSVELRSNVPAGHKVALRRIAAGAPIRKYGQIIGFARAEIEPGDHVHLHNLLIRDYSRSYEFATDLRPLSPVPAGGERTFLGFNRANGRAGTRNYIAVISS